MGSAMLLPVANGEIAIASMAPNAPNVTSWKFVMALIILRVVFLAVAIALGMSLANSKLLEEYQGWVTWTAFLGVLSIAACVLVADSSVRRKKLDAITAVFFGLFIGLVLTYVFRIALTPFLDRASADVLRSSGE